MSGKFSVLIYNSRCPCRTLADAVTFLMPVARLFLSTLTVR